MGQKAIPACPTRLGMASRSPLVLIPQYFGALVFDRHIARYFPFDREAAALLIRLASASFDALRRATKREEDLERVEGFFRHFYKLGFFDMDLKFAGEILQVRAPRDHLVGPLAVHLEVSAACNLKCQHCFAGALPRKERPLTIEELDTVFASMARVGAFRLGLTGGEPLLRRDIFDILDSAVQHGLCPCLTTNGLLITEEIAREFGRRKLIWLNVSLEGATAKTNDLIRGQGTFERVMEKLTILLRHTKFTLVFTVLRTNLSEVTACAELALKVGAEAAVFRPLYPVGVARHHPGLMPSYAEYCHVLETLRSRCTDQKGELQNGVTFGPDAREPTRAIVHDNYGCGAGNRVCSISVSGNVSPCSFLGPEYVGGNLRHSSLEEIWHRSQVFREIRQLRWGGIGEENVWGGCRARALAFNGSIEAADPWLQAQRGMPDAPHPLVILEGRGLVHCN